jgi:hypothetical protein
LRLRRDFLLSLGSTNRVSPIQARGAANRRPLLLLWRFSCRRQLENGGLLTFNQSCQKNDFAVWELERIVVGGSFVLVVLSEDRGPVADHRFAPRGRPLGPSPNLN